MGLLTDKHEALLLDILLYSLSFLVVNFNLLERLLYLHNCILFVFLLFLRIWIQLIISFQAAVQHLILFSTMECEMNYYGPNLPIFADLKDFLREEKPIQYKVLENYLRNAANLVRFFFFQFKFIYTLS